MRSVPAVLLLLAATGCSTSAGADVELRTAPAACRPQSASPGPLLLQQATRDVPGPTYAARTDGPCGLVVTFVGAPEGDGPCAVAEYVGHLEPDGDDLRLDVEARHTGEQPSGRTACTLVGQQRSFRVAGTEPLAGRRLVDAQGHALQVADGAQLLRPGALPEGWTEGPEGQDVFAAGWSLTLLGPSGLRATLREGDAALGRPGRTPPGFGAQVRDRPTVRGVEAVLTTFDEPPGNAVLQWVEGDRGYALQALGPLPRPEVLAEIADALR
ncbi:MAG: hypothetical protein JWN17_3254 [Frankiales bacterium]|nr:hypothetical protein [Frankiales bacterium]